MNRRIFISGLVRASAVAWFDPHRVFFDMGRDMHYWDRVDYMPRYYSVDYLDLGKPGDQYLPLFLDYDGKVIKLYPSQERANPLMNIQMESHKYGLPPIYADPHVVAFDPLNPRLKSSR